MKSIQLVPPLSLSLRERFAVTLAWYCALNHRAQAFRLLEKGIADRAIPLLFGREFFLQISLLLGVPFMLEGLEFLKSRARHATGPKRPISLREARRRGTSALRAVYGTQAGKLIKRLEELHPGLGRRILLDSYGQILSRRGLSLRERELINVTILFILRYEAQLYSHLRGALRAGIDVRTLSALIRFLARRTAIPSGTARTMIKNLTSPKRSRP